MEYLAYRIKSISILNKCQLIKRELKLFRHTGEGRCPYPNHWIPAFAGMTTYESSLEDLKTLRHTEVDPENGTVA
jgi:hypothetical protein